MIFIRGSEQFYHGCLFGGQDDAVGIHPADHAASNEGGHVAEVQFLSRGQRLILTPVSAASRQHKAVARDFPVP